MTLKNKEIYLEFISNKLRYPSYLSLEYVLAKNQILSENVYAFTSITRKTPRTYTNKLGTFSYRNISETLFTGFQIITKDNFTIAIATKPKALFDYLYLKLFRQSNITAQMISDLRLNLAEFSADEIAEFEEYCKLSKINKYLSLSKLLFPKYDR